MDKVELSSTFALFELGKSGLSWCNSTRRSVTQPTATMKGSGYESPRFCGASTDYIAAALLHPHVSSIPRPDVWSYLDDWQPDHYQHFTDRAPLREGAYLLL